MSGPRPMLLDRLLARHTMPHQETYESQFHCDCGALLPCPYGVPTLPEAIVAHRRHLIAVGLGAGAEILRDHMMHDAADILDHAQEAAA